MSEIQAYLFFMNNKYLHAKKEEHILFVEGYSDKKFYSEVFWQDKELRIDENNIWINFDRKRDKYNEDWILYYGDVYRQEAKNVVSTLKDKYKRNYDFVIAATHESNLPPKENCKINCFGFVDKDFGEKKDIGDEELTFYSPRRISQTEYHDRESSLIFAYMPTLYDSLKDSKTVEENEYFIEKLADILYFSTCQGILENLSIDYKNLFNSYKKGINLYDVTHDNFRDCKKWKEQYKKHGQVTDFNFLNYLQDVKNQAQNQFVREFINLCIKEIKKVKKIAFKPSVLCWIKEKKSEEFLEKAFLKSNGHILANNIQSVLFRYIGFKNKEKLEDKFIPFIKEEVKADSAFRNSSPIKEYLKYRKDILNRL